VSHRIVIAGKRGTVYLLRERLGGVGSAIDKLDGCTAFSGGAKVDNHTVLLPCLGENAIKELHVTRNHIRFGWTAHGIYGSPVIAGHRVYVADRNTRDVVVLRLRNGEVVQRHTCCSPTHFPSLMISGGVAFFGSARGISALAH
jgi:hypothetical protein